MEECVCPYVPSPHVWKSSKCPAVWTLTLKMRCAKYFRIRKPYGLCHGSHSW